MIRLARIEDAAGIARVRVDTWRTAYSGIVPDEYLANMSYAENQAKWTDRLTMPGETFSYVAEDRDAQVVAFAFGSPLRDELAGYDGELIGLYVLPAFQGQGLGRRLVGQVSEELARRGFHALVIWALKENPAVGFYERLGGRPIAEKQVEIGGKALMEVAYGWENLAWLRKRDD